MEQVVAFIRSNGPLLFAKDSETLIDVPADDYDYVHLESKAKADEDNEEVKRSLPSHEMKRAFDVLVAQSEDLPVLPADQVRSFVCLFKCCFLNNKKEGPLTLMHSVDRFRVLGEVEGPCPLSSISDSEKINIVFFQRFFVFVCCFPSGQR